jgi:hypothetical protein
MQKCAAKPDAEEKAPRLIMNVGIRNQLVALLVIRMFEDIWFGDYEEDDMLGPDDAPDPNRPQREPKVCAAKGPVGHIKHQTRDLAFKKFIKITRQLTQKNPVFLIEGDGSAWDTCVQLAIRNLVENQMLDRCCKALTAFVRIDIPVDQVKEGVQRRKKGKESYKAQTKVDTDNRGVGAMGCDFSMKLTLKTIRESGDRGTALLNQAENKILWHFILFKDPLTSILSRNVRERHALNIRCSSSVAKVGYSARHADNEEGDDSALALQIDGPTGAIEDVKEVKQLLAPAEQLWQEFGFNMKIEIYGPDEVSTYCGANFLVGKHGLEEAFIPEILRSLSTASWTTNPTILAEGPDSVNGKVICYASFMARAASFPHKGQINFMREFYRAQAMSYTGDHVGPNTNIVVTHELARKTGTTVGADLNVMAAFEESRINYGWMNTEACDRIVELTAGGVTHDELLAISSFGTIARGYPRAAELLPRTWCDNPKLPVCRVDDCRYVVPG